MTQPQQHPEELLAEFVDGTLGPEDRTLVESHLSTCASCREEVALAAPARTALSWLPDLDVPAGTTWPVVQRARRRRRWLPALSPRVAWATAGAAAVLIVAAVLIGGQIIPTSQLAEGPAGRSATEEESGDAGAFAPGGPATSQARLEYPTLRLSDRDYDGAALASLADELTADARRALDQGFPEPPSAYYTRTSALLTLSDRTQRALSCVVKAVSPDRSLAPFTVVVTRFEGEPAYIGAFLQADRPDQAYGEVVLYVVSRDGCALRSFARQQL